MAFALLFIGSFWMELGGLVNQSLRTACLGVSSPTWPIPRDLWGVPRQYSCCFPVAGEGCHQSALRECQELRSRPHFLETSAVVNLLGGWERSVFTLKSLAGAWPLLPLPLRVLRWSHDPLAAFFWSPWFPK